MTRVLATACLAIAFISSGCMRTAGQPVAPAVRIPAPELQGTWKVVAIEASGAAVDPSRVAQMEMSYEFDDTGLTIRRVGRPDQRTMVLVDSAASPKIIAIGVDPAIPGLYAVDGDVLKLCLRVDDNPGGEPPIDIASRAEPATDLLTMQRVSPLRSSEPTSPEPTPDPSGALVVADPSVDRPESATAAATIPGNDSRTYWAYENAPIIFPDQGGVVAGSFRRDASGAWKEDRIGGSDGPRDWVETARTDEYVEISRPGGGFFLRLYSGRSEYRYGYETEFTAMFPGEWNEPTAGL